MIVSKWHQIHPTDKNSMYVLFLKTAVCVSTNMNFLMCVVLNRLSTLVPQFVCWHVTEWRNAVDESRYE